MIIYTSPLLNLNLARNISFHIASRSVTTTIYSCCFSIHKRTDSEIRTSVIRTLYNAVRTYSIQGVVETEFRARGRCRLVAAAATAVDAAKTVRASKLDRHAFPAYPVDGEGARTLNRLPRLWTLNRLPRVPLLLREVKLLYVMRHGCRMPRLP